MSKETTADMHDRFVEAVEDADIERAARIEERIRTNDEPLPDLLEQFNDAVEAEEFERAKTLMQEINGKFSERRTEENARVRRVAHARDNGALTGDDLESAEEFLRKSQQLSTERLSFVSNAIVFLERQAAIEKQTVTQETENLKNDEETLREQEERATSGIEDPDLPPSLEIVDTSIDGSPVVDDPFDVTVTVYNSGDQPASELSFTVETPESLQLTSESPTLASLSGDTSRAIDLQFQATGPGDKSVTIEATGTEASAAVEQVTVEVAAEPTEPTVGDYTGDDEVVDTADLRMAIQDWARGDIDTDLLRDLIQAWARDTPVE